MAEYRLKTFGGLSLHHGQAEDPVVALQRSRLAILVVVAAAGEAGIARDKLAALFWPESDDERSRNALNQALFGLRRGTAAQLVTGTDVVRFSYPECDVDFIEFERAVDSARMEEAIALYSGPFLEGVRFRSSAPFERWVEEKRDALSGLYGKALRKSFEAARETGDIERMLVRSRARAALLPYDASVAEDLVRTLCRSGDFEAARRQANLYERLIIDDLGSVPDPRVGAVISECVAENTDASIAEVESESAQLAHSTASLQKSIDSEPIKKRSAPARSMGTLFGVITAAALVIATIAGIVSWQKRSAPAADAKGETIAVFPFCVQGGESDSDLSGGMVDLIVATLPGDTGPRPLDSRVTIAMTSKLGNPCALSDERARLLAAKLGANYFITGNAVVARKTVLITGRVIRSGESGVAAKQVVAESDADSIQTAIRGFTNQIQAMLVREPDRRIPDILSRSAPALRYYLHGRALWRAGQKIAAINEFVNALDEDSTFALAGLALSEAGGWFYAGEYEASSKSLIRVSSVRGKLSRRDQALLDAANGAPPRRLADREALDGWKHAVDVAPDTPTAWYEYGDRLFHVGASVGLPNPFGEAKIAFDKAVALDSGYALAIGHLIEVSMLLRDTAAVKRYAKLYESAGASADFRPFVEWRLATFLGDAKRLDEIHAKVDEYSLASLHRIAGMAQVENTDRSFGMTALRKLQKYEDSPMWKFDAAVRLHDRAVNDRNWLLAEEAFRKIGNASVNMSYFMDVVSVDALRLTDIILGGADSSGVRSILARLEKSAANAGSTPLDAPRYLGENCALGLWYASRDSARASVVLDRIASIKPGKEADKFPANGAVCTAMIRAERAAVFDARTAHPLIDRLDSLAMIGIQSYGMGFGNFETARLYAKIGDRANALRAVKRRRYDWTESVRYLSASRALQARLSR